jgi:heparanase 1
MREMKRAPARVRIGALAIVLSLACAAQMPAQAVSIDPANMSRIAAIDTRFASYNIEMAEVTGGSFWKPYGANPKPTQAAKPVEPGSAPAGMDPNMYQYRPPLDLSNPRLRKLAAALSPAYIRVSGTWANTAYFADSGNPLAKAPAGFSSVLTQREWKGVIDFVHAVNGELVTSFATGAGTRNSQGVWTPKEAERWLAFTKSAGGQIAAAEFMNEPTYAAMGGAPKGYDASMYSRDIAAFGPWLKRNSPTTVFLGPGSVGEGPFGIEMGGMLHTEDLMKATGPVFDVFSYHLYAAASERCASMGEKTQTTAQAALTPEWLSRPEKIDAFYAGLRDRFEQGKSLWITETADAACGGNPWASSFLDTFRYLVEHAGLARRGVKVIMHNTLAASDYGLLDPSTFEPRPNYWATLLWRKLMGTTVLDPHIRATPNVYSYAHCLAGRPGGVAVLVINADRQRTLDINVPMADERYTLTAHRLEGPAVQLNGQTLHLTAGGELPQLKGEQTKAGRVSLAPVSVTYLAVENAGNNACR